MATTWTVRPQTDDRRWLLTNGEIVKAPALEETPSGRKVRVVGTEIDGYARDIDSVIRGGLDAAAKSRGASVWMPIHDDTNWYFKRALGVDLEADLPRASIHLLGRSQSVGEQTVFWWRFKHPEYPQLFGDFMPYMSTVDMLFNCGERSLSLIESGTEVRS